MRKLTIGFSTHREFSIYSSAIKSMLATPYSHVYVRWHSDSAERDIIYQASGLQVNFVGTKLFEEKNQVIQEFTLDVSDDNFKNILQFSIDNAGVPYGVKQVFGLFYSLIGKRFNKNLKNPFADGTKTEICSELAARILDCIGIKVNTEIDLDLITPKDVFQALEAAGIDKNLPE